VLEPVGREHKTHVNTKEPISFGVAQLDKILFGVVQLDNFFGSYCFVYINLLQGK
jgi:hypothetical protein